MNILITGCTGTLAEPLATWLQEAGHEVTGVSRNPECARARHSMQVVGWDRLTTRFISSQRIEAIVNFAGAPMMQRWNARSKAAILRSRLAAVRVIFGLLEQLPARQRPECVVNASSVSIYSSCTLPVDEFSPLRSDTRYFQAQVWQAVEHLLMELELPGVRTIVIRLGLVIGADKLMQRMLRLSRCYLGSILGDGRQRISWIARQDMLRAVRHLLIHPELHGVFNLVAPRPVTAAQLGTGIARSVNRPALLRVPETLLRTVLGELAGNFLISADAMPARLQMTGFNWELPSFEQALRVTVDELRRLDLQTASATERTPAGFPGSTAVAVPAGRLTNNSSVSTAR